MQTEPSHWGRPSHIPFCPCFGCYQWRADHPRLVDRPVSKPRRPLPPDDPRHGTEYAYQYWWCRCDRCKAGAAAAKRARWNPLLR